MPLRNPQKRLLSLTAARVIYLGAQNEGYICLSRLYLCSAAKKRFPKAAAFGAFLGHFLGRAKKWHSKANRSARAAGTQYERP